MKNVISAITRVAAVFGALVVFAQGTPALAGDFHVRPIAVHIKPGRSSDVVTISNQGAAAVRLQVTGYQWSEDGKGADELKPSSDLVFFPLLLEIPPGAKKSVRIGLENAGSGGTVEKTYRVFVEELPSVASQFGLNTAGLELRTRIGIPVFLDPRVPAPKPQVAIDGVKDGILTFRAVNSGNAHYIARKMHVVGRDAKGGELFQRDQQGWYVLANQDRPFSLSLDSAQCRALRSVEVTMDSDSGAAKATTTVEAASCPK